MCEPSAYCATASNANRVDNVARPLYIDRMAQTKEGAIKVAAARCGITVAEYNLRVATNEKWCTRCKRWHLRSEFGNDSSRFDGLASTCARSRDAHRAATYIPKIRISKRGARYAVARAGDKKQARARVNHLVHIGLLPNPNTLPCARCGHLGTDRRHEYDHLYGYDAEHQEDVQSLCTVCHSAVSVERGEIKPPKPPKPRRGADHPGAKLTTQQVVDIKARAAAGETHVSLAEAFGCHKNHIGRIVRGERW